MATLGQRVRASRKQYSLTQKEFSDLVGVSQSFLSEVENNKSKPSIAILQGIAERLPIIHLDWLLTGAGSMADDYHEWLERRRAAEVDGEALVIEAIFSLMDQLFTNLEDTPTPDVRARLFRELHARLAPKLRRTIEAGTCEIGELVRLARSAGPWEEIVPSIKTHR